MSNYTVLIIEDDAGAREALAKFVTREGYRVLTAENGLLGGEICAREQPQIVISDIKMPEMNGHELLRYVKDNCPLTQVILITGYDTEDSALKALQDGALDYLKKPLDLEQLSVALGRAEEKIHEHSEALKIPVILIAEDNDQTRMHLSAELKKEGWETFEAPDGQSALKIFSEKKIDIVLTDVMMPHLGGLSALHEMRKINSDFECIILSGYGEEANAIRAMRDGAFSFLKKPVDLEQLLLTIGKAMARLTLSRALKYRVRDLELSRELVLRVTSEKDILIQLNEFSLKTAVEMTDSLLDIFPLGVIVVDRTFKIRHINNLLSRLDAHIPHSFTEELFLSLHRVGISGFSYKKLHTRIRAAFSEKGALLEKLALTPHAYIALVKIKVIGKTDVEDMLMIAFRGERGSR